jgi:hypothetical protein
MQRPSHDNHRNQTIPKLLASVQGFWFSARVLESRASGLSAANLRLHENHSFPYDPI